MTKLTQAQTDILTGCAQADGGVIDAAGVHKTVAATMIRRGLMISLPLAEGGSRLLITDAGRAAVGLPMAPAPMMAKAPEAVPTVDGPKSKIEILIALLQRPEGTTVEAMIAATGWQAHSIRGAMSGALKKDRGLAVTSAKTEGGRVYRIAA